MNDSDLTPWIPGDVKPVHVGYYSRSYHLESMRRQHDYWDGKRFLIDGPQGLPAKCALEWRGLRKPADAAQ